MLFKPLFLSNENDVVLPNIDFIVCDFSIFRFAVESFFLQCVEKVVKCFGSAQGIDSVTYTFCTCYAS